MHHVPLVGHPGKTRTYANMRRQFYLPHMASKIFATVRDCPSSARERLQQRRRNGTLYPFHPEGPLEDIVVDLLGPFNAAKKGYKMIMVLSDRFNEADTSSAASVEGTL